MKWNPLIDSSKLRRGATFTKIKFPAEASVRARGRLGPIKEKN